MPTRKPTSIVTGSAVTPERKMPAENSRSGNSRGRRSMPARSSASWPSRRDAVAQVLGSARGRVPGPHHARERIEALGLGRHQQSLR